MSFSFPLDIYPEVKGLGHPVVVFLTSSGASLRSSTVAAPVCTPTSRARRPSFLHTQAGTCQLLCFFLVKAILTGGRGYLLEALTRISMMISDVEQLWLSSGSMDAKPSSPARLSAKQEGHLPPSWGHCSGPGWSGCLRTCWQSGAMSPSASVRALSNPGLLGEGLSEVSQKQTPSCRNLLFRMVSPPQGSGTECSLTEGRPGDNT